LPETRRRCDLLVVGGGPAGTTTATLFKRYAPHARVILLESAVFPRHHVGESLLPGMLPVLREMGVDERISRAGFVRKVGATFVWGRDREPWDADFSELKAELESKGVKTDLETTWQVPRAEYDALLLAHARDCGVEVLEGARALAPIERGGAVVGVRAALAGGARASFSCGAVADCSGQAGFLSKFRPIRRYREDLKNVAVYGYFRGAPWKFRYSGVPGASRIFVCSAPEGWFWYIPIAGDLVSVGLVSKASDVRVRAERDMREFFLGAVSRSAEISGLLEGRPLERGLDRAAPDKDLFTASDWSYESLASAGRGWYAAGDAAFFIDPLLSTGVMMAHLSGQRCAYALLAERSGAGGPSAARAVRADYESFCREVGAGFLDLVKIWYEHEPSAKRWFAAARRHNRARGPIRLSSKGDFTGLISGITATFERLYPAGAAATNSPGHAWRFRRRDRETHVFMLFLTGGGGKAWDRGSRAGSVGAGRDGRSVRVLGRLRTTVGFAPIEGTGRLGAVLRAEFSPTRGRGIAARRSAPSLYGAALRLIDGRRTVAQIAAAAAERLPLPAALVESETRALIEELVEAGALSYGPRRSAARPRAPRGALADLRRAEAALADRDAGAAEYFATRAAAGPGRAWGLALRALAREALGRRESAEVDFEAALAAAARRRARRAPGVAGLRADFDAAVERGWLDAAILEARLSFHERGGRGDLAREDLANLRAVETDRGAARGVAESFR
jgi:clorobiocin biosynthesis protein Clo-hal